MSVTVKTTGMKLEDIRKAASQLVRNAPRIAGRYAVEHTRDNILKRSGQPVNGSVQKFAPRKYEVRSVKGKKILMDSRTLANSIKIINLAPMQVSFGVSDNKIAKYAQAQNEGADIPVTAKMKKFFWAKHYEAGGKKGNADSDFWKGMALKKTGSKIHIKARRFIDITPDIIKGIGRELDAFWNSLIKK